jgi:Spy/CpxP family protein refolding chaperone
MEMEHKMKTKLIACLAATVLSTAALAQGYGYGPGMMGGYGPMGPGMGPEMMGPGMMGGWGYPADLSADQRSKIAELRQEFQKKQWALMQQLHTLMWSANAPGTAGGAFDEQAARKNYDGSAALHKQMFENAIDFRKRMDAVLTPQQRDEMRRGWHR